MIINLVTCFIVLIIFALIGYSTRQKLGSNINELKLAGKKGSIVNVGASLFTLIGAGELITLSTLAFLFGYSGLFLFLGYALAFIFLGLLATRIRSIPESKSSTGLVDFATKYIGPKFGMICFLISFAAFFALLMLQFTALGLFMPDITGQSQNMVIIAIGLIVFSYLAVGGLHAVFRTDMFQASFMVLFLVITIALIFPETLSLIKSKEFESSGFDYSWGLAIGGFFVAIASADVWQRMFAAADDKVARKGFVLGGVTLFLYGILICLLGMSAAVLSPEINPDMAFFEALKIALPAEFQIIGIVLMLAALVSTADTEMFVLTTMLDDVSDRLGWFNKVGKRKKLTIILAIITFLSVFSAIMFGDLIAIYTWLLFVLICLSPVLWLIIFTGQRNDNYAFLATATNILFLIVMLSRGMVTLDNIYILVIPCSVTAIISILLSSIKKRTT